MISHATGWATLNWHHALLRELQPEAAADDDTSAAARALAGATGLLSFARSTLPYIRWRDVLFIHAGPIPGAFLEDHERRDGGLWDGDVVRDRGLGDPAFGRLRAAGVRRVVVGHVPGDDVQVVGQGTVLSIDTDAPGLRRLDDGVSLAGQALVTITPHPPFDPIGAIVVPTVWRAAAGWSPDSTEPRPSVAVGCRAGRSAISPVTSG